MTRFVIALLLPLVFLACLLSGCHRLTDSERLDKLFRAYQGPDTPGAAMVLIEHGKPLWTRCYGLANVKAGRTVRAETNFRLASVSKQFTACAVLLLIQDGALRLDDTLTDCFADFPAYGRDITIDQLLHHTSGLLDYENLADADDGPQLLDRDVRELLSQQDSTYFVPGSQYRYSNSGYALLAQVVEMKSGLRFADFLQQRIFRPLGMQRTVAYEAGRSEVVERALGMAWQEGGFRDADQSRYSAVLGDGGIYSSLIDLAKWDQALYADTLLSTIWRQYAFTPDTLADGTSSGYGCGWRIDRSHDHLRIHHTGQTCGFTTVIQRFPQIPVSLIILSNRHEPMLNDLADRVMDLYFKTAKI